MRYGKTEEEGERRMKSYRITRIACYQGYITQAIVNTLAPLLFVTFQQEFSVSLEQITFIITLNFLTQLVVDLAASKFIGIIGYRVTAILAHVFCTLGLFGLASLPYLLPSAYAGLLISTMIHSIGGGLIEVIISPIIEALPGEKKAASMSLLHSFYCWGCVAVILLTTLFFQVAGHVSWRLLPVLWAIIPLGNIFLFTRVPLITMEENNGEALPLRKLFTRRVFLLLFLLMVCAGASEQAMSQWASYLAEAGLQVSKTMGNLLGPCMFAVLMGLARILFGLLGARVKIEHALLYSSVLCIASYLLTVFSPSPILSLLGCGICGFSVGILWPGTFSLSAKYFPQGGTAMFAILALAGDLGCAAGPSTVGGVSSLVQQGVGIFSRFLQGNLEGAGLKAGLLVAIIFPLVLLVGVLAIRRMRQTEN